MSDFLNKNSDGSKSNGGETNLLNNSNPISPDDEEPEPHNFQTSMAGVAGNILEWYDFAVFGYFSDAIGANFFPPNQEGNAALLESFAVFGMAFLVRPVGGAIIGKMGDTSGRKGALETSIFWMAFSTAAMGFLPTYEMVGPLATVLLILMRLIQGLSVGGQLMSSLLFTLERTHMSKWGWWGGVVIAATSVGVTLGSVFAAVIVDHLPEEQVLSWGWRIPFLFGSTGALPALYLKLRAKEQPIVSSTMIDNSDPVNSQSCNEPIDPLRETFSKSNRRALVAAILVPTLAACAYYIIFVWLVIFMESILVPPIPNAFTINTINGLLGGMVLTLVGGWFADYVGDYKKTMVVSTIVLGIISPIACGLIGTGGDHVIGVAFVIQLLLSFVFAIYSGAFYPWVMTLCPPEIRLTTISMGYNVSLSIFGGFAPLVATILADQINFTAPGFLITMTSIMTLIGLWIAPETPIRSVDPSNDEEGTPYRLV